MIDLRIPVDPLPISEPLVLRLQERHAKSEHDAILIEMGDDYREYDYQGFSLTVRAPASADLEGDVLLLLPGKTSAHRLIRANSPHNTFLLTEQCDQLCMMCSQPPKKHHTDLFDQFAIAASLAPAGAYLGLSGGEPLLHKVRLFEFLSIMASTRPDLRFHVLTNGQHFNDEDRGWLSEIGHDRVLWGIPLYAPEQGLHDQIVGKHGAFERLETSFSILAKAGSAIELRTVVMAQNNSTLPALSDHVSFKLPFIRHWALMQLENIGYGRMNWDKCFIDTSADFHHLAAALSRAIARGIEVSLFNFPLCTLPENFRHLAPSTISDWKRKYLPKCDGCDLISTCGGFFEWYIPEKGFARVGAP
ncbi:His-Xaa-Ser system radical SAM maturase HxsC [Agrobacterium vitis]|uniref:His-Xaa-Ser system radical SAM maturase HxsC n=1 Tax=Agrobacterium vitis TaxID=373 RepID=A0A7K1RMM0_AGRVI|nr:His-Xaa-Ser system radical SAM maturase HxsC [Agrobacterium vitis]MVA59265.1 His-Xaa-Ser system radical SAM maturase HxsC [Agrobacterium vitis]